MAQRQLIRLFSTRHLHRPTLNRLRPCILSNFFNKQIAVNCRNGPTVFKPAAAYHNSAAMWSEHIFNIQDEQDFQNRVMSNSLPVIVDFHASWCAPCKLLGPRIEAVTVAKGGKVLLAKVDVDQNSEIAMEHKVTAVPTVLLIKNGEVVDKFIGLKEEDEISTFVDGFINKD